MAEDDYFYEHQHTEAVDKSIISPFDVKVKHRKEKLIEVVKRYIKRLVIMRLEKSGLIFYEIVLDFLSSINYNIFIGTQKVR